MKITFLGTSHGVPEANRKCSCTLIDVNGRYYFIDMGVMAINDLVTKGISVDAVKGIFITHMHGDHINGLIGFADLISWYYRTADPVIYLPDIAGEKIISDWITCVHSFQRGLHYEEIKSGVIFDDGFLKVSAIPTQHICKSYAFLVEADGKYVLFTGDLKNPSLDFPEVAKKQEIDLAVCEGAHFSVTEYESVLGECKIKKICINHYVPWNIPDILQLAENMGEIPVIIANDGMEIMV